MKKQANGVFKDESNEKRRQHIKDLLNGDVEANENELELYKKLVDQKDFYMDNGMSEEDAISEIEQDIGKIQNGYIDEYSTAQRFKGNMKNVKDRFKSRFNFENNSGNNSGSNS